ncbi:MAG: hypothetical protein ACXVEF_36500 [Polyangiales bacterium]
MRRPLRPLVQSAFALVFVTAFAAVGCDDPKSLEWQVKHVNDSNPLDRGRAIDGLAQQWRNVDQGNNDAAKKEFKDKAIEPLAQAYKSDALKELSKDRKKIMDILSQADDKRAKPAFVHAISNYKPGDNDDEVKSAVRAIQKNKADYQGDDELGKALVAALKNVKFADHRSGELGAMFGDAIAAIKATGTKNELLAMVTAPNDGMDTVANKEMAGRQVLAAQALGEIGDASLVNPMIDAMFDFAAKMAKRKDPSTGEDIEMASPLTTAISMTLGGSIAKIGEPAIAPLMPYVKDDQSNPKVKAVNEKFKKYISPGGSGKPTAYVDIATTTVANIGLPKVATEISSIVRDKKTKDTDRKPLIGLLVSLPADENTIAAIKEGYANSTSDKLKTDIAASASRLMDPSLTDWLLDIYDDKKAGEDLKTAALSSAIWLAPNAKMGALKTAFDKAKLSDKRDPVWNAMEPTEKECDPKVKKLEKDQQCEEHPDKKGKDGKPLYVIWNNVTPKYSEEIGIVSELTTKCTDNAKCYFTEFQAAVKDVDKQGFTKVTSTGTRAGIKMQKAIWMLAMYGKEDDMIELVKYMPNIQSPAPRSFVQMALDKNLKNGSLKVADAISKLVKSEREKGSETANREASQLEPIANKLRARAASGKK